MAKAQIVFGEVGSGGGGLDLTQKYVIGGTLYASTALSVSTCPFEPKLIVVYAANSNGANIGSNMDSNGELSEDTIYFFDKNGSAYATMSITKTSTGFTGDIWSGYNRDYICMLFG